MWTTLPYVFEKVEDTSRKNSDYGPSETMKFIFKVTFPLTF